MMADLGRLFTRVMVAVMGVVRNFSVSAPVAGSVLPACLAIARPAWEVTVYVTL